MNRLIILFLLTILILSCNHSKEDEDIIILNQIFDDLITNNHISRTFPPPPPPAPIFDNENNIIGYDTNDYKKTLEIYEKNKEKLKNNDLVIALYDSLFTYNIKDKDYFLSQISTDYIDAFENLDNQNLNTKWIDLKKIKNIDSLDVYYLSDLTKEIDNWNDSLGYFSGILRISRIYLNKSYDHGYLYCSVYKDPDSGWGQIMLLKKIDGVWSIDKIIPIWVS